jgi:ribosome-binding factor A
MAHRRPGAAWQELEMAKSRSPSVRQLRVGEELRHRLAAVLDRGALRDPALRGQSFTVTEVRTSPDLRNATVFIMPLGGVWDEEALRALNRASPFLRGEMGRDFHLKYLPRLTFARDESYDEADRIDRLLRSPEVARDLEAAEPAAGEDEDGAA